MKRTILKNIFSNWTVYFVLIFITFFMTPVMLKYLGKSGYGIWLLVNSLTGYLGMFGFGIQSSTTKYVAQYLGEEDIKSLNILVSTTFCAFSVISIFVFIITALLSVFSNKIFAIPIEYQNASPYLILIIGSQISVSFLFATVVQIFSGMQRYEINASIETISLIIKSIFIYFFLISGHGLIYIALISFIFELLNKLAFLFLLSRLKIGLRIRISYFEMKFLRKIVRYSLTSFFISITSRMMRYTDNLIIAAAVSIADISLYGVANRLVQYMQELVKNATNVLSPAASYAHVTNSSSLKNLALYSAKYTALLVAPIAIAFCLVGDAFFFLWLGDGFSKAYPVLLVLTLSQTFAAPLYGIGSLLYGIEKHQIIAKMIFGEAMLNLIISLILVRFWGIIGVAIGSAIPSILFNLFIFPSKITNIFNITLFQYYRHCLFMPFLMALPFAVCLLLYKGAYDCRTWLHFLLGISFSTFVYAFVVYQVELKPLLLQRFNSLGQAFRSVAGQK